MTTEEGVRLLLRGYDSHNVEQHSGAASSIVTRLGGLALAIDQAAAYIRYKQMPLDRLGEFMTTYEAQQQKVLSYTPPNFWEYGTMQIHGEAEQNKAISAFTTWEMSFQQLKVGNESRKKDVAHFLTLSAFFDPIKIGEAMFHHYWAAGHRQLEWMHIWGAVDNIEGDKEINDEDNISSSEGSGDGWDSDRFWEVITKLHDLSLLQSISSGVGGEGASFSLHPLIRDWLQLRANAEKRCKYIEEAIEVVSRNIVAYERQSVTLEQKRLLMAHIDTSISNDRRFSKPESRLGHNIVNCSKASSFAHFYHSQGRYGAAEGLYGLVIRTQKGVIGEEHTDTLTSTNDLATLLRDKGKYEQAEEMLRQALELRKTVLGQEHPDTLTSINNLATVMRYQGKVDQAEEMLRQALELREMVLGQEHPDTLTSMDNLATVRWSQGKYKQAEEMHRQALELRKTVLGQEHPDTLSSMNNLATTMRYQGKYEQAEEMLRQALELRGTVLGQEHPNTLKSMNNLANVLRSQGKYEQAEKMHGQALELRETVLGQEHPDTLKSMNNLANVLGDQGKYKQAEEIHGQVLDIRETVLGQEHPDTLKSMNNLASVLKDQGKYKQAEEMRRQALELRETVLGQEHPETLWSIGSLA
jgi:tetratricopeptide (TPR) repeat protein